VIGKGKKDKWKGGKRKKPQGQERRQINNN
jgi:hypothetical protein